MLWKGSFGVSILTGVSIVTVECNVTIECEQFGVGADGSSQKLQFEKLSMSFGQEGSVSLEQAAWWGLEALLLETFQSQRIHD